MVFSAHDSEPRIVLLLIYSVSVVYVSGIVLIFIIPVVGLSKKKNYSCLSTSFPFLRCREFCTRINLIAAKP